MSSGEFKPFHDAQNQTRTTSHPLRGLCHCLRWPVLSVIFDEPATSTVGLAVILSSIALGWSYAFNTMFEYWESSQSARAERSHGTWLMASALKAASHLSWSR